MADRPKILVRAILLYGLLVNGVIGVWASVSPRGWYDDFPGFGLVWVAVDGPFNEHLVRDVAAWSLGLAIIVGAALWTLERRLLIATGAALAVQSLLHAQYHLSADNPFDTAGEQVQAVGGIVLMVALGAVVSILGYRSPATPAAG